jgi:hypothetical protein
MARNSKHRSAASAPGAAGVALGAVGPWVPLDFTPLISFIMRTFLLSAVFAVMVSLSAFATPPSVVLVQFHGYERLITITRGAGKTESIQTLAPAPKNYAANAEQLQALFAKLYEEGYVMQATATSGAGNTVHEVVSYVFVKP